MMSRARHAAATVLVVGLIPLIVSLATARAWVVPTLIVVGFAAVSAGCVAWLSLQPDVPPPDPAAEPSYTSPPVHHERIARVRRSLVQSTKEPASFDRHVRPVLAALADDRLSAAYGITMTTSPDAARARLGEDLWQRLTTDSDRPLTSGELRQLVASLDRLSPPN
jgi:hypothetical protein